MYGTMRELVVSPTYTRNEYWSNWLIDLNAVEVKMLVVRLHNTASV